MNGMFHCHIDNNHYCNIDNNHYCNIDNNPHQRKRPTFFWQCQHFFLGHETDVLNNRLKHPFEFIFLVNIFLEMSTIIFFFFVETDVLNNRFKQPFEYVFRSIFFLFLIVIKITTDPWVLVIIFFYNRIQTGV